MDPQTIYARTPKGEAALAAPAGPPHDDDVVAVLAQIDGQTTAAEVASKMGGNPQKLLGTLERLIGAGLIEPSASAAGANNDLDFTSMAFESERKARTDAEARATAALAASASADRQVAEAQKAREEAQIMLDKTRLAHERAVEKAQAETMGRAQAEKKALAERRARSAAEDRAKQETVARVMQEHQLRHQAEKNISAKVDEELRARKQADLDDDIKARLDSQRRADVMSARLKLKQEDEAEAQSVEKKNRPPIRWGRAIVIGSLLLLIAGLGVLHIVPLSGISAQLESTLAERIQEPVSIGSMTFSLVPFPQFRLERIAIGKTQDVKIGTAIVPITSLSLLQEHKKIDEVQLVAVAAERDALLRMTNWVRPQSGEQRLQINRLTVSGLSVALPQVETTPFDAVVNLAADGSLQSATLNDAKWSINLLARDSGLVAKFNARDWKSPFGAAVQFSYFSATATIARQQAVVSDVDARVYNGSLKGAMTIKWGAELSADGQFTLKGSDLGELLPAFTSVFSASGVLDANGRFASTGRTSEELFKAARITANFTLQKGVINNVDLVRGVQSPSRTGQRGGKTQFSDLTGEVEAAPGRIVFRNLKLSSGALSANGAVEVTPGADISGRVAVTMGQQGAPVARGMLTVSGSVKEPILGQ